ncbi:biotin--[acetyl-CoA-carboxylase] ligase [Gelria sp. Kuro-4]|uniref:biotin--[acetyl-CoA-carboxylase] ligase n=1 Tax=Gelria sp. Kuro-4 TaxID=2796927 RepID=UPI001BED51EC|nr:biotin--[acetyl-CoA-carboxylase] ligase [Gelria sp. Kuro-4]BCV24314.1 bifunctional ligase/repressor BirA [Gelria sp. Kuro-4]
MDQDALLALLAGEKGGYTSGEEISRALRVSRTAVWKYINDLRQSGYDIEAHPRLGYRLLARPDKLLPAEVRHGLKTARLGQAVHHFETITSTNDVAKDLAERGAPEGTLVVAEEQKSGRGRRGRAWSSPPRVGIWASLLLRPAFLPSQAPLLTLTAAVAGAEAIRRVTGLTAGIKWPNDLLIGGRKVAGILMELSAEQDVVLYVILGIGINVNTPSFPGELAALATSLYQERGESVSRRELLQAFLERFEFWYDRLPGEAEALRSRWRELSVTLGRRVTVTAPTFTVSGLARNIDREGALLLETETGDLVRILSGDVSLR